MKPISEQVSPKRFYDTEEYWQGKALIASRTKTQFDHSELEEINLAKSMVLAEGKRLDERRSSEPLLKSFVKPKDLMSRKMLQMLAVNRRKFGEALPTNFKTHQKRIKPKLSNRGNLEKCLREDIIEYTKLKVDCNFTPSLGKSPLKTRPLLISEQETLIEQMDQMTPLNQMVLNRAMKYGPIYRSQLNFKRNLEVAKRLEQIKPSKAVLIRAKSLSKPRSNYASEASQMNKTGYLRKRLEEFNTMDEHSLSLDNKHRTKQSKGVGYKLDRSSGAILLLES